ncbi:hypothetical protein [Hymenobacter terricola]|uniref:hypothetical protein n=1 Tax=Hymenobacter terricola TaxID=2819236 RepID=UPI001B31808C|nr:hypothetical protein [Hymenobacter terricola]
MKAHTLCLTTCLVFCISFCASAQLNKRQTEATAYGIKFKSSDIDGFKGAKLAPDVTCLSPTLSLPITRTNLYALLGRMYRTSSTAHPQELFDVQSDYNVFMPILDSIDYKYYDEKSLFALREGELKSDTAFAVFDLRFKGANNKQRRELLYHSRFRAFRPYLEKSRFTEMSGTVVGTASRDLQRSYTISIADSITADVKQLATIKHGLSAAIRDSIQRHSSSKFIYHKVYYTDSYRKFAGDILKNAYDKGLANKYNDQFSMYLRDYFRLKDVAVITGVSVLQASFETVNYQQLEKSIKGAIEAKLKKGAVPNLEQVQAKISSRYFRKLTTNNTVTVADKFYNLRMGYSKELEVGNGTTGDPDALCSN